MGAFTSRQNAGVEEVDVASTHAYRYPPRSGNYFGSHFIMGGERFDTPQPESYLFGENTDLNFLGSRPTPFPYPPPQPNEPTKTLKSLVNIRKESLRFVRLYNDFNKVNIDKAENVDVELGTNSHFNIEFTFDCDVRCSITIYYFCTEETTPNGVTYVSRDPSITSETFHFMRGANQQFSQPNHVFNPSKYPDEDLLYDVDREVIPIAIHCVAEEGADELKQSHTTVATVEKLSDGTYLLKALKQKLYVDGLCYLLQEIYGIENKNNDKAGGDDDTEDNGSECVICMCDVRDTLILPCRHLCLCNSCADSLRYQANNCPICRAPFRALLQIRALQKSSNPNIPPISPPDGSCDNIPPGYEAVSLIEALNGPCTPRQPPSAQPDLVETPENENAIQAAQLLNRQCDRVTPSKNRGGETSSLNSPEYSASAGVVMMTPTTTTEDEESKEANRRLLGDGDNGVRCAANRPRDTMKLVNEKTDKEEVVDEDSEAEKLSPLLQKTKSAVRDNNLALNMADVVDAIDDADTDQEEPICTDSHEKTNYKGDGTPEDRADESDYYTPEEQHVNGDPLSGDGPGVATFSSVEGTPQRLPGTPISLASGRSSGAESCASGSSTRRLLAPVRGEKTVVHL
ncbi:probable E3 ubiquitin-protein ligase MGRN1 [Aethina tumida]|uniref:probable E3 ubiquitin-protein ligase MGRN1 n=1 Tax=Aethina tumida TaxID=116153 RepID=UPI002148C524|nr:probable E3 ubiquitin-protein ligase MGRN1 [Aethina tumida]